MLRRGRINYKPGRKERREMRRELSPEDFEIFRQNRLSERAAKRGITVDQLLEDREQQRVGRLSGKYARLAGRMRRPKRGANKMDRRDRFEKESANASPESFEALQKALSEARQEIQDFQNQKNSTAATPVKEEIIERKIKGYLGERPVYEDENIRFTDNNWEII